METECYSETMVPNKLHGVISQKNIFLQICDVFAIDSCTVKIKAVTKLYAASKQTLKFHAMSHHPSSFTIEIYKLRHVQTINK
jgi:hypothetical protein